MLSEDWNAKWSTVRMSHGLWLSVCVCVCVVCVRVYNSPALAWDRCASMDNTISVVAQPAFYYCLVLSQLHPKTSKQVEENNHKRWDLTCANYKRKRKPATQRAECIFGGHSFSRHVSVIIIPGVAHVWSQRAVQQCSARCAQSGMCKKRWWWKQVLWLGPSSRLRGRKRDRQNQRRGSRKDNGESSVTWTPTPSD